MANGNSLNILTNADTFDSVLGRFMVAHNFARNAWMQRESLDMAKKELAQKKADLAFQKEQSLWELGPAIATISGRPIPWDEMRSVLGMEPKKGPTTTETRSMLDVPMVRQRQPDAKQRGDRAVAGTRGGASLAKPAAQKLPTEAPPMGGGITTLAQGHDVEKGQSPQTIADIHHVDVMELMEANRGNLYKGGNKVGAKDKLDPTTMYFMGPNEETGEPGARIVVPGKYQDFNLQYTPESTQGKHEYPRKDVEFEKGMEFQPIPDEDVEEMMEMTPEFAKYIADNTYPNLTADFVYNIAPTFAAKDPKKFYDTLARANSDLTTMYSAFQTDADKEADPTKMAVSILGSVNSFAKGQAGITEGFIEITDEERVRYEAAMESGLKNYLTSIQNNPNYSDEFKTAVTEAVGALRPLDYSTSLLDAWDIIQEKVERQSTPHRYGASPMRGPTEEDYLRILRDMGFNFRTYDEFYREYNQAMQLEERHAIQ